MERFLQPSYYVDLQAENVQAAARELFAPGMTEVEKAKTAYHFVRDEMRHSFDCHAQVVTVRASEVLRHRTGICHAKANLLAALLRTQGIPTGFSFQRITYAAQDESMGYCTHAFNAVYLGGRWVKLDARGNKPGIDAQFSLGEPILAYPPRPQFAEFLYPGIYAAPQPVTMRKLENSRHPRELYYGFPDELIEPPDIPEAEKFPLPTGENLL